MASSRTNSSWKLFAFLDSSHQNAAFEGLEEADAPISGFWVHKTQMFLLHSALQDAVRPCRLHYGPLATQCGTTRVLKTIMWTSRCKWGEAWNLNCRKFSMENSKWLDCCSSVTRLMNEEVTARIYTKIYRSKVSSDWRLMRDGFQVELDNDAFFIAVTP